MTKDDLRKQFVDENNISFDPSSDYRYSYITWLENKIIDMDNNIDILLNKLDKS